MQVTRKRRAVGKLRLPAGRKTRVVMATSAAALLLLTGTGIAYASSAIFGDDQVGTTVSQGLVVSDNQIINPYGTRLEIPNGKIMGSVISPDGTHMAATLADGPSDMVIINLSTMAIQQYVRFGSGVGQESPTYSPDGSALWMGTNTGYAKYAVAADGSVGSPVTITLPTVNGELPLVGKAVFSADGSTVYAAVNGQNTVVAMNASTGAVTQTWNVGNAPRDLLLVGSKLYVSDEGGRTATSGDTTLNSYGTQVPASDLTGSSTTGAVSVIDLSNPSATPASIAVGLHPTALSYANGAVFVANTNSDTVSVIDARTGHVVQTIGTQPWPEAKVGYEPDAITVTGDGHLLVSLGGANAIAVYKFDNPHDWNSPRERGQLHRPDPDGLLPGGARQRQRPGRGHQHARHRRAPLHHGGARHARHHVLADLLHDAERWRHPADDRAGLPGQRLDRRTRSGTRPGRQGTSSRCRSRPGSAPRRRSSTSSWSSRRTGPTTSSSAT